MAKKLTKTKAKASKEAIAKLAPELYQCVNALFPIVVHAIMCGLPVTQKVADARNLTVETLAKIES